MQFDRSEVEPAKYKLTPLPAPSVDTGMGLERLCVVLQGVKSNYETDLLKNIVEFVARLSGRSYEAETQEGFAMRVIADHARATAFSIADGILPANEGRNYVLRKIMRRAIYQGRHTIGFEGLFFHKVTDFVIDQMHEPYPDRRRWGRRLPPASSKFRFPGRVIEAPTCIPGRNRRPSAAPEE